MALSPSIPTSFVPKQPVAPLREKKGGWNVFWLAAAVLFLASVIGAGGVFAFKQYLVGVKDAKLAELQAADEKIRASTVTEFVRLRDRFDAAHGILENHIMFSHFLEVLEARTIQNVRFSSLKFNLLPDGTYEIGMEGVARTFNALAAQSSLFNEEQYFKRAIFSDIAVNANNTVNFTLSALLDPALLAMTEDDALLPAGTVPAPAEAAIPEEESGGTGTTTSASP